MVCAHQAKAAVLSLLSRIPLPEIPHGEEGLFESIYLLLTSVIVVPLVCKLPGGSPVLGFLVSTLYSANYLQALECPKDLSGCAIVMGGGNADQ